MRSEIHPKYEDAVVRCGCGNSWETRSTKAEMRIEICSKCHPFFTGEQRIIDTAGRVERFRRRYGIKDDASMGGSGTDSATTPEGDAAASEDESAVEAE